jgi:hypothetical protein
MSTDTPTPDLAPSTTPRTDEAQFGTGRVSVGFARQLETELAARDARIKELEANIDEIKIRFAAFQLSRPDISGLPNAQPLP